MSDGDSRNRNRTNAIMSSGELTNPRKTWRALHHLQEANYRPETCLLPIGFLHFGKCDDAILSAEIIYEFHIGGNQRTTFLLRKSNVQGIPQRTTGL